MGVQFSKRVSKWGVHLTINKNHLSFGYYDDVEKAIELRLVAEKEYFGEFAPQKHLFEKYDIDNKNLSDFDIVKPKMNGKNGVLGVHFNNKRKRWISKINNKYISSHIKYEDAVKSRLLKEIEIYGYDNAPQKHLFNKYGITKEELLLNI
jgi:lipopolysaccharide biosynthesis protein